MASVAVKCLLIALLAFVLRVTNDAFLMVRGSESTSFLVSPVVAVQVGCLVVFAAALFVPANRRLRVALTAMAFCAALLGSHRLVVDNLHNQIRDVYLAVPVQSLTIDPAHEGGLSLETSGIGFRIGQAGRGRTLWCFSPGLLGLDPAGLKRLTL